MAWPSKIYVATTAAGVYYTDDFVDPSTQPTWTAVNDGLGNLACQEFSLDPFHQAERQYVLLDPNDTLYRRENGGNWTPILTPAICDDLFSGTDSRVESFFCDPTVEGRIIAIFTSDKVVRWCESCYSNDYGETWHYLAHVSEGGSLYGIGVVREIGNNIWCTLVGGAGAYTDLYFSYDGGLTWGVDYDTPGNTILHLNPNLSDRIYLNQPVGEENKGLSHKIVGGAIVSLQADIGAGACGGMWFNPDDVDHQRLIYNYKLYVTEDRWSTINTPSAITGSPTIMAPWAGADTDQMLMNMLISEGQVHAIGCVYGEDDTTLTGIAGANCGDSPGFVDSIPYTCGGVCRTGIQAVQSAIGKIYTHAVAMPGYDGADRGIPIQGDRSAWEASNYPLRHTDDADEVTGIHHTLGTDPGQASPGDHTHALDDLSDVDAAAPNDDDMLVWDDTAGNWVPVAFVLPDHDHSGDAGDGGQFDAANLTSGASGDGQVLTSDGAGESAWEDLPALADHDHSGDAGDGNTFDAANLTSGASTDGQVLTSDGTGEAAWEDVPGGADPNAIHDNVASEIHAITEKASPIGADELVIEDSADSYNKKRVQITNLPTGSDADAIHDNVASEIHAVTEKASPVGADELLIEDSADSYNKKRVQITNLPTGSDASAIHDNVASEIHAITEKASPVDADEIVIEDSADSYNKKRVQISNLPGGGAMALDDLTDVDAAAPDDQDVLTWDETAGEWVPAAVGGTLANHDHSGDAGDGGTFDAANLTSGASDDGQILTSDGAGGAAWEDPTAGAGDVMGPATSADGHLAVWDGTDSKTLKDGGAVPAGGSIGPADITNCVIWLKADAITGKSDDDSLDTWPDESGYDHHAVAFGSPLYKTNIINSLPVVRLDGDDYFNVGGFPTMYPTWSWVIVFKMSSLANAYTGILTYSAATDGGGYFLKSNGKSAEYWSSSYDGTGAASFDTTNWNYVISNHEATVSNTRRNGAADRSNTGSTARDFAESAAIGNHMLYGGRIMSGDIAELAVFNRALTSTEITALESYITGKYSL